MRGYSARGFLLAALLLAACPDTKREGPDLHGAGVLDPARSTIRVDRPFGALADGKDRVLLTVALRDRFGLPLSGLRITLDATGTGNRLPQPLSTSDAAGEITSSMAATVAGLKDVGATVGSGPSSVRLASTAQVQFLPAPARLGFRVQPATVTAGASFANAIDVQLLDAAGNPLNAGSAAITLGFANNAGGGRLYGTLTLHAAQGVAGFPGIWIDKAAPGYTLAATAQGLAAATSQAFEVTHGTATGLAFKVQPAGGTAGAAIAPAVQVAVVDAYANTVSSAAPTTITVALNGGAGGAALSGTTSAQTASGVAVFNNLVMSAPGTGYKLDASAAGTGYTSATSAAFDVSAVTPDRLLFAVQPVGAVADEVMLPALEVVVADSSGRRVVSANDPVTLALDANPPSGALSGTLTRVAASGVAVFDDLKLDKASAGYTLKAASGALTPAISAAFPITPLTPSRLGYTVQPVNATPNSPIAPAVQVSVLSNTGKVYTTPPGFTVTVALGNNPGGSTLTGTVSAATVNGVASFPNLQLNNTGAGYTLLATATGPSPLIGVTSAGFHVAGPGPPILLSPDWGSATGGTPIAITIPTQTSSFGPATTVTVDGAPLKNQVLVSPNEIQGETPRQSPGSSGAAVVLVTTGTAVPPQTSSASFAYKVWQALGPEGGTVEVLAVPPGSSSAVVFAATHAGLYKSTDNGTSWMRKSTGLDTAWIDAIAFEPGSPSTVLLGTRIGVYKSTDEGETWGMLGGPSNAGGSRVGVESLAVDPNDPARMLAGGTIDGVFRSTDGGRTWTASSAGLPPYPGIVDLAYENDPAVPAAQRGDRMYAGNTLGNNEGFWISNDGGQSWSAPATPPEGQARTITVDPFAPSTVYFTSNRGVFRSTDRGANWVRTDAGIAPAGSTGTTIAAWLEADPSNAGTLYVAASTQVYKSTDRAMSWTPVAAGLPGRAVLTLALPPVGGVRLLAGVDSFGVYASQNHGAWTASRTGIYAYPLKDLAVSDVKTKQLVAVSNASPFVWRTDTGTSPWTAATTGFRSSANAVVVDPNDPNDVYVGTVSEGVWKSDDGGKTFHDTGQKSGNIEDLAYDGLTPFPGSLWAVRYGSHDVMESVNRGVSWTTLGSSGLSSGDLRVIVLPPFPQNVNPWVGCGPFTPGVFYHDGTSWQDKGAGLPTVDAKRVEDIAIDSLNPQEVYLATWEGVFRSLNGGGSWTHLGGTTLGSASSILAPEQTRQNEIWAGHYKGAALSRDDGQTWEGFSAGIEGLSVRGLVVDPGNPKRLLAVTSGGVFALERP